MPALPRLVLRLARALLLIVAVVGLVPGAEAFAERAAELACAGHAPDQAPGDVDPCCAEHGCAPTGPNCACPHAQPRTEQRGVEAGAFRSDRWAALTLGPEQRLRHLKSARGPIPGDRAPASRATAPPTPPANA